MYVSQTNNPLFNLTQSLTTNINISELLRPDGSFNKETFKQYAKSNSLTCEDALTFVNLLAKNNEYSFVIEFLSNEDIGGPARSTFAIELIKNFSAFNFNKNQQTHIFFDSYAFCSENRIEIIQLFSYLALDDAKEINATIYSLFKMDAASASAVTNIVDLNYYYFRELPFKCKAEIIFGTFDLVDLSVGLVVSRLRSLSVSFLNILADEEDDVKGAILFELVSSRSVPCFGKDYTKLLQIIKLVDSSSLLPENQNSDNSVKEPTKFPFITESNRLAIAKKLIELNKLNKTFIDSQEWSTDQLNDLLVFISDFNNSSPMKILSVMKSALIRTPFNVDILTELFIKNIKIDEYNPLITLISFSEVLGPIHFYKLILIAMQNTDFHWFLPKVMSELSSDEKISFMVSSIKLNPNRLRFLTNCEFNVEQHEKIFELIGDVEGLLTEKTFPKVKKSTIPFIIALVRHLKISDPNFLSELAFKIFEVDSSILLHYLDDFNLSYTQLVEIAEKSLIRDTPFFLSNIEKFRLQTAEKNSLLLKAASMDGGAVAKMVEKLEIDDKLFFKKLAKVALQNDPKVISSLENFGIDGKYIAKKKRVSFFHAIDEKDEDKLLKMINDLPSGPVLKALAQLLIDSSKYACDSFAMHWACKLLNRAGRHFQEQGDSKNAVSVKLATLKLPLNNTDSDHPLNDFENKANKQKIITSPRGDANFGAVWSLMGGSELKGAHFKIKTISLDNQIRRRAEFKVTYFVAEEVRSFVGMLQKEITLAEEALSTKIEINYEDKFKYESSIDSDKPFKAGKVITLTIKNCATIQIGNERQWGSMHNAIFITLEEPGSLDQLHKALSLIGLAGILFPSTKGDLDRIKVNRLIHYFYPAIAAKLDLKSSYYECPLDDLLLTIEKTENLPGFRTEIMTHLNRVDFRDESTGEKILYLKDQALIAETLGARGLLAGFGYKANFKQTAMNLHSVFMNGMLSTQLRFGLGWLIKGISSKSDFRVNAADSIFLRVTTQEAIDKGLSLSDCTFSGFVQAHFKTKLFKRMGSGRLFDQYGQRTRYDPDYSNRPNFESYISALQKNWLSNNEFLLKNTVPADIGCITYQDPREHLVHEIEKFDVNFLEGMILSEKVDYLSNHKEDIFEKLKNLSTKGMKNFISDERTYKMLSIDDHWTIDPLAELKKFVPEDVPIIKTSLLSEEIYDNCNKVKSRSKRLEAKCRKIACTSQLTKSISEQASIHYIQGIRGAFQKLSEQELFSYLNINIESDLATLNQKCDLTDVDFSGRDSLNRELLTSDWNYALKDYRVILSLFALEELNKRVIEIRTIPLNKNYNYYSIYVKGKTQTASITDNLYHGLKDHSPLLLEKMPLNSFGTRKKEEFLAEYLRRSKIHETFVPILEAIEKAHTIAVGKEIPCQVIPSTLFGESDAPHGWLCIDQLFETVLQKIDASDPSTLLELASSENTPLHLRLQFNRGISLLLENEGKISGDLSIEEICDHIAHSVYLLDPWVGHLLDRIHLTAALTAQKGECDIMTKNGPISPRELVCALVDSLHEGDTSLKNITTEQLSLRLLQIQQKLTSKQ